MENPGIKARYKLIACGVLKKELDAVMNDIPDGIEIDTVLLEQGLHREPERLNTLVKSEIARAEAGNIPYDALLLGYGVCSRGTLGVSSARFRIVVPRAHDCITLFLGSKERYIEEFSASPGTYWFTPGFVSGSVQPGMSEKYAGIYQEFEGHFEEYLDRFGDADLAHYVIEHQEQAWIRNYSRGAYVESGLPGGKTLRAKAKAFCNARDWRFEEVTGDLGLLRDLLSGEWDNERFLVLEPGETVALGSVHDIITSQDASSSAAFIGEDYRLSYIYDKDYREVPPDAEFDDDGNAADIVIGIDAGGTYTDAAVVSLKSRRVLHASKSPTTHHDLSVGIQKALEKLPIEALEKSCRLAISTTLATNAIVEDKGARAGLLLIGYETDTAALVCTGARDIKAVIPGRHDIYGTETVPLDEAALMNAAVSMIERGVEALAVSSYMATRNPAHEIRALEMLRQRFNVPLAAGHELTDDIDSVRRAHTVLLNARLLPVIAHLIHSVRRVVETMGLPSDVRLVTTDGTLMNTAEALELPVRLVLSGPAASVKGVRFLTDLDSYVLIDMGGTTSDIAVIEGGSARRTGRGACVGSYKTSIRATDIRTIGLGGDSGIGWENGRVRIGPRRVVPLSVLALSNPGVSESLEAMRGYHASDYGLVSPGLHYILVRMPGNNSFMTERERAIIDILSEGPVSIVTLAERLVYPYLSLIGTERLEEIGLVRRCGLTPTDLMAADGRVTIGDRETAKLALELFAERSGLDAETAGEMIWDAVHRQAASAILTEVLQGGESDKTFPACPYCESSMNGSAAVSVTYQLKYPLVGVGAPAQHMLEGIGRYLLCDKEFPAMADVANAVGAAAGTGGMHLDMTIIPDAFGRYILYSPEGKHIYGNVGEAKDAALAISRDCAVSYAARMGYARFALDIHVRDRSAPTAFGTDLYIDTSIVSTMRY